MDIHQWIETLEYRTEWGGFIFMKALWIWASLTLCRFQEVLLFFFTDAFFHEPVPGIKEIEKH